MELAFSSVELRALCEDEAHARASLGDPVALMLKNRVADLDSATCVGDLLAGRPRLLDGPLDQVAVDLADGACLVFVPNHRKTPKTPAGELDWKKISRIKLVGIEKNHD